jgi:tetratricopeptide (TPR) repeat protein
MTIPCPNCAYLIPETPDAAVSTTCPACGQKDVPTRSVLAAPPEHSPAAPGSSDTEGEVGRTGPYVPAPTENECRGGAPTLPGYEILDLLGRGGMGVVYKALQSSLKRVVALKIIRAGSSAGPDDLARFHTEAEAIAQLQHPHIVQIYEIGEHDGLPYLSLEFVGGGNLKDYLAGTPMPPRDAAMLAETLAQAVFAAHERGIIHRDLKPANILLAGDVLMRPPPDGARLPAAALIPKITDFGLAKQLDTDSGLTQAGQVMGTPSYMAPEQAAGLADQMGPRVDVYALGAILYEMLTGRPPFRGATVQETLEQVRSQEPVSPRLLNDRIPRDLETICLKAMAKEPARRYQTARELAADLRRFLAGQPVLARPVPAWERAMRWCVRNPRVAALFGAVAILLMTVAVGSLAAAWKISREKERAENNAQAEKQAREKANLNAQEAKESQALASKQAELALQTVYDVVTKADEKLKDKEAMGPLRQELLEIAMGNLGLVARELVASGKADRTMGAAVQRMGTFYEQMGRTDDAIGAYKNALTIFDRLIERYPEEDRNRANAAVCYDNLGDMGREVEPDPKVVFTYYQKALELRQALVSSPQNAAIPMKECRELLSISCVKLGTLALWIGDPAQALAYGRKALEHSLAAAAVDPKDVRGARLNTSGALLILGRACAHQGLAEEGRGHLDQCRKLRQEMVQAEPSSVTARQELGRALEACGDLEMELGRFPEARDWYHQAQEVFAGMAEKDPSNPEIRWYLANARSALGLAQQSLHAPQAEQSFRSCLKTREVLLKDDPQNRERKIELMLALARLGQHEAASTLAQEVAAHAPRHPGVLFAVACGYGECIRAVNDQALQNRYADKAAGALTQAVAHGYRDSHCLQTHPDLQPLRHFPIFKSVLTQADKPTISSPDR